MPINTGYAEATKSDGALRVRIYYDAAVDPSLPQPLINGPAGWCLEVMNETGQNQRVDVRLPSGEIVNVLFGQGSPVVTGPASGRSRTAIDMAALGFVTRRDIAGLTLT